jgi:hypothetical protein
VLSWGAKTIDEKALALGLAIWPSERCGVGTKPALTAAHECYT